jgi:hypothetical protein
MITIPDHILKEAPKALQAAAAAYNDAISKLQEAETAVEDLQAAEASLGVRAAHEALAAVRSGATVAPSIDSDVSQRIGLARRSVDAYMSLVLEREAILQQELDTHAEELARITRKQMALAADALIDNLGKTLARYFPTYREARAIHAWANSQKWNWQLHSFDHGYSVRYYGQTRSGDDILADGLRLLHREHPDIQDRDRQVKALQVPGREDWDAIRALLNTAPPAWAATLGVDGP